jgi:TonB-linked SusC/RagA family outer membrane protein
MKYFYLIIVLLLPLASFSQTLKGTVKDTQNQPLSGITIYIKGTKVGTSTDRVGAFQIQMPVTESVLVLSGENVVKQEIIYSGQTFLTIVMQEKENSLDDVQVIAYGTNTQRNTVGSITKVSGSDISAQPITNPLAGLEGRVPGLEVTSTSGIPGSSFNVQIRGQNTVNPNLSTNTSLPLDQPLFIVDGVPFAPQNANLNQFPSLAAPGLSYNNPYGGISPLNSLNPSDIESIEVLRDADATAIYGSRGGNGVIIITTKKGKAGKSEFNVSLNDGESFIGPTIPMMNTNQYLSMRHQAFVNDGLVPNNIAGDPAYAPDLTVFDTTRNTDWKKYFFGNTAHDLNLNASLSGGTANTQFRIGTGFNRDSYIFPGDLADNRATFSTSIHHTSDNKRFTLDFTANYSYDKNNSAGDPGIMTAYTLEPDFPNLVDSKGNLTWSYNGVQLDGSSAGNNPLAYLKELYSIENISLNSNLQFGYKITDGLTFRTSLGYSTYTSQEYYGDPLSAQDPEYDPESSSRFGNNNFVTWIIEPQLEYKKVVKKAQYDFLAGGTLEKKTNAVSELDGYNYSNDDLIQSIAGSTTQNATDSYTDYRYVALFARFNLKWDDKYLLDITGNRDGSSRFGPNREFGNFGSVGAGWLFNEESFVKNNLKFLSYGKLRGSYGITGNDNAADYEFLSRWAPSPYSYNGTPGYVAQNLYNPDFSWATTKKLEFGLELGFLSDRLLFSSTWYRSRTGNQLITYNLPSQTGFTSILENENALVQNTGLELSLQGSLIKGKHIAWTSSINFTFPENKLLAFPGLVTSSYSTAYQIGKPLSEVYGFRYAGVNPADGYFQFKTANGQISENPVQAGGGKFNDFVPLGNTDPKFYGGWQNSITYGQFQLNFFLSFKKQMGRNYLAQVYGYVPGNEINEPVALLNSWKAPGQQTNYEKLSTQYGQSYTGAYDFTESSGAYSDASYIRFKTISFSYSLPESIVQKLSLQNLRFYISGQNLFTITSYKGNDPETQNFYGVPPLKTLSCGLQITL